MILPACGSAGFLVEAYANMLKNQVALGTVNAGRDAFEAAVSDLSVFLERWPQAIRQVITGRFPIEGYRDLLLGRPAGIKNVIALAS